MLWNMDGSKTPTRAAKLGLAAEWAILFLGVPAAYAAGWVPITILPVLLIMAAGCGFTLRRRHNFTWHQLFPATTAGDWRKILLTYAVALPCLVGLLWATRPLALFSLPLRHPLIWMLVMVAYPVLSVLPQELIYRVFFFERYRPLFGRGTSMVVMSAVAFSFGHIVFHNWPAVALTFAGGWLFGRTYQRTSSLLLVAVEHALYGCAIFTIGYGNYFFEGTLRIFRL